MFEKLTIAREQGLELPLGRTLLLLLLILALYLFPGGSPSSSGEDAFVGLVFGLASGLAAWVVFAPAAGWKRRLLIALAIASSSGISYSWDRGVSRLVMAAVVGTYVDAALALSLLVFLVIKLAGRRGRLEGDFQFGIKHLLVATLVVIPVAMMLRVAMADFSRADVGPIAVVAIDAMAITLAAQWFIGTRQLALGELIGRTLLVLLTILGLGILLPQLPLFQLQLIRWHILQSALGGTILAGYLLPRLDHFVVSLRPRQQPATDTQQHHPNDLRDDDPPPTTLSPDRSSDEPSATPSLPYPTHEQPTST